MIPLKLQLKNFISYGAQLQTVNFEPYNLICLSGKNGHGKSALLDAITWVLWGHARKAATAKADEGLLRLGQNHMMVTLDFACNGIMYRVRREYAISGSKATSHLDFGIFDEGDQIRSLSEKTIRSTQEKIDHVLRLNYESFSNSAFLRQGQSNEFSKKSARDRKEILATILGLDHYEQLRKKAAEKARILAQEKELTGQNLARLHIEVKQRDEVDLKLTQIQAHLAAHNAQEETIRNGLFSLQEQKEKLEKEQQAYMRLRIIANQHNTTLDEHKRLLLEKVNLWRKINRQSNRDSTFSKVETERTQLERQIQQLRDAASRYQQIKEQYGTLKEQLQKRKEELLKEYAAHEQEIARILSSHQATLAQLINQLKLLNEKKNTIVADCQKLSKEMELIRITLQKDNTSLLLQEEEKRFERRKTYYHRWIARGNALKKESKELYDKREFLKGSSACCPLCNQALSLQLSASLTITLERKQSFFDHQVKRLSDVVPGLKQTITKQHEIITTFRQRLEEHTRLKTRLQEMQLHYLKQEELLQTEERHVQSLKASIDVTQKNIDEVEQKKVKKATIETFMHEDRLYKELVSKGQQHEALVVTLASQEQEYYNACNKLTVLTQQSKDHEEFRVQRAMQEERKQEIHKLCLIIKRLKQESILLQKQGEHYKEHDSKTLELRENENAMQVELKKIAQQKEILLRDKGALQHHQSLLDEKAKELQVYTKRSNELDGLIVEYQALAQAFSKEGVQALLIEEAIPEIEQEANNLLGKLTDNQAHLIIESVRDLKSGATKETLDIKISDAIGIRPYELFSGGEAFRIDFALRTAISKLLARRAGAALQLLIIDEGFGSQDEEGLAHITDALYKMQDDFAKIIVVSHLPIMKDQFPVQFLIQKTPSGSSIHIVEQG